MSARCKGGLVIPVFFYKEHLTIDYSRRINDINATNNLDFICRYFSYFNNFLLYICTSFVISNPFPSCKDV